MNVEPAIDSVGGTTTRYESRQPGWCVANRQTRHVAARSLEFGPASQGSACNM